MIASLGGATPLSLQEDWNGAGRRPPISANRPSGFFLQDGDLYQISVTPVYVQSTQGQALLNVLVAGYRVDALVAQQLKKATGGSEFLFLTPGGVIASTLNPRATAVVVANIGARRASDGPGERRRDRICLRSRHRCSTFRQAGGRTLHSALLRCRAAAHRRASTRNIILLWLLAVSVGLGLTYLLARRIVEPVKQLDRAAAEVARQNYAIEVEVSKRRRDGPPGAHVQQHVRSPSARRAKI